ncbi:MAG: hypothetical protein CMH54_15805 [Myxococcales bacterium]|nr:hypothetical protein [Myxococcales bacterium]
MKRILLSVVCLLGLQLALVQTSVALDVPKHEQIIRESGLRVLVIPDTSLPYLRITLAMPVGSLEDHMGKSQPVVGRAGFAAGLMEYGTGVLDDRTVAQKLDGLAANFTASASRETIEATGDVITIEQTTRDNFLDMFFRLVLAPSYTQTSLEKYRRIHLGQLQGILDSNTALADRAMGMWALRGQPHAMPVSGTPDSVKAITTQDLRDFHERYIIPEHTTLIVGGDITSAEVHELLDTHPVVRAWEQARKGRCKGRDTATGWCQSFCVKDDCTPNQRLALTPAKLPGAALLLLTKDDPELNQEHFRIVFPMVRSLTHAGWFNYRLGVHILGGGYTARMNRVLRIENGLTYGARISNSYSNPFPGFAHLRTYTRPEDVTRALDLALEQMDLFVKKGPSPTELERFRDMIINKRAFLFEKIDGLMDQLLFVQMYAIGLDFLRNYEDNIRAVKRPGLIEAIREVFSTQSMRIVVVGREADAPALKQWIEARGGTFEMQPSTAVLDATLTQDAAPSDKR